MRWSCGVFVGFILAIVLMSCAYYHFYLRKNPDASAEKMQMVEDGWSKAKASGDQVIETIRPYAVPAQNGVSQENNPQQPPVSNQTFSGSKGAEE